MLKFRPMTIKIVRRPIGEAPEWVRDAWIGLTLPSEQTKAKTYWGVGVLTGPVNMAMQIIKLLSGKAVLVSGYAVNAKVAVDILAETQPAAAEWWRLNTSKMLNGKRNFVFDADVCETNE